MKRREGNGKGWWISGVGKKEMGEAVEPCQGEGKKDKQEGVGERANEIPHSASPHGSVCECMRSHVCLRWKHTVSEIGSVSCSAIRSSAT